MMILDIHCGRIFAFLLCRRMYFYADAREDEQLSFELLMLKKGSSGPPISRSTRPA